MCSYRPEPHAGRSRSRAPPGRRSHRHREACVASARYPGPCPEIRNQCPRDLDDILRAPANPSDLIASKASASRLTIARVSARASSASAKYRRDLIGPCPVETHLGHQHEPWRHAPPSPRIAPDVVGVPCQQVPSEVSGSAPGGARTVWPAARPLTPFTQRLARSGGTALPICLAGGSVARRSENHRERSVRGPPRESRGCVTAQDGCTSSRPWRYVR